MHGNAGGSSPLAYGARKTKETTLLCELPKVQEETHPVEPENNLKASIS